MTFFRSLLVLATAISLLLVPYSWGHALSNRHTTPIIVGAIAFASLAALVFFLTRRRGEPDAGVHQAPTA